jgi:hypothetical protein
LNLQRGWVLLRDEIDAFRRCIRRDHDHDNSTGAEQAATAADQQPMSVALPQTVRDLLVDVVKNSLSQPSDIRRLLAKRTVQTLGVTLDAANTARLRTNPGRAAACGVA